MSMTGFLSRLLQLQAEKAPEQSQRTLKDLDYFDSVWIKDNGIIYEGWVFDITRRCIVVCYGPDLLDFRFHLEKPLNCTELIQGDKTLYCNQPKIVN